MARKRGLGNRGLDELLGVQTSFSEDSPHSEKLVFIAVEQISQSPYQPRKDIGEEELQGLAASIRAHGMIQPLIVRSLPLGKYELIAGERRWRASQLIGMTEVPVIVKEADDRSVAAMSLIENIQREELNPLEEAEAIKRLIEEFELTHQQIANSLGRSRTSITNLLRLLELDSFTSRALQDGQIEMGHARALLMLKNREQQRALEKVIKGKLNVRQTEALVKGWGQGKAEKSENNPDPDVLRLEKEISERLGARVKINCNTHKKGSMVVHFNNFDELEGILKVIGTSYIS